MIFIRKADNVARYEESGAENLLAGELHQESLRETDGLSVYEVEDAEIRVLAALYSASIRRFRRKAFGYLRLLPEDLAAAAVTANVVTGDGDFEFLRSRHRVIPGLSAESARTLAARVVQAKAFSTIGKKQMAREIEDEQRQPSRSTREEWAVVLPQLKD